MEKILFQLYSSIEKRIVTAIVAAITEKIEQLPQYTQPVQSDDTFMDLKSAAKYLGVSENTLKNFRIRGLKVLEIGNVKRVRKSDLDKFITKNSN